MIRPASLLALTLLLVLGGCVGFPANTTIKYRAICSTRLTPTGEAADNVQAVDTNNGKVYLQTSWHDLTPTSYPYRYRVELYDGTGALVYTANDSFTPGDAGYVTTSWYSFRPVDAAGFWKFKIYLNNHFIAEKPLLVTRDSAGTGMFPQGPTREF